MIMDKKLTQKIKSLVLDMGAELVGVAPVSRFENAPEETKPTHYMPDAANVISIGIQIANGVCDVWGNYDEPGKSAGPYLFYGYGLINLELSRTAYSVAKTLEKMKYKSLTFPPTWAVAQYRFPERVVDGVFLADFSHRHAAVAAGLGELGWHGLCITPKFGTRVRFNSIITNAPLTADSMYEGPKLCQPEKCKRKCAQTCPTKAISTESVRCQIGGRAFEYSKVDKVRCLYATHGYVRGSGSRTDVEIPPGPGNVLHYYTEAKPQRHPVDQTFFDESFGIITGDFCGRCLRDCPAPI